MFASETRDKKSIVITACYITVGIITLLVVALMCIYAAKALVSAHEMAVLSTLPSESTLLDAENVSETKKLPLLGLAGAVVDEREPMDIRIPRCDNIHLSLAEKTCDFKFTNPESNGCYLRVSITRHDTNETVFTSSLISPGKTLENISLSTKFSYFASHDAMVKVDAYSMDELSFLNSLVMDAVIYTY